jgi:hypothetical protein
MSGPVTVSGFGVTFSAFGSQIGADQRTVDTALMEPGEAPFFVNALSSEDFVIGESFFVSRWSAACEPPHR